MIGVAGSADALAWLRLIQNHLGDWHDLVVLEQMMIDMLAGRNLCRAVDLGYGSGEADSAQPKDRLGFEEKYLRMSRESAEMHRLKEWISYVLGSPSAAAVRA